MNCKNIEQRSDQIDQIYETERMKMVYLFSCTLNNYIMNYQIFSYNRFSYNIFPRFNNFSTPKNYSKQNDYHLYGILYKKYQSLSNKTRINLQNNLKDISCINSPVRFHFGSKSQDETRDIRYHDEEESTFRLISETSLAPFFEA